MTDAVRVLVVDDDAGLRTELRQLLEDAGYAVVAEASTGAQGVAQARLARPHVVISDLRMPGEVSGLDLAAALQGEVPVIILSAYDDAGLQARARQAGALFLVKGCRSRTIFAALDRAALDRAALACASVPG
ncbi:MAG: response regulator [Candidatus Nanopelagicales bacterium]|jgi:response regulator NasT|nr:response regulator [Candidatus Nanopelagicales bacterium]